MERRSSFQVKAGMERRSSFPVKTGMERGNTGIARLRRGWTP